MSSFNSDREFSKSSRGYLERLNTCFSDENIRIIKKLADALQHAWAAGRNVYICGNGGSAANAIHMANDLHYGIGACGAGEKVSGIRVEALPANAGVITCLANDTGYENIFAHQLKVKAQRGDLLIVLSGSGRSANVCKAIKTAKSMELKSFAIVAFDGGQCRELADEVIHFEIDDMQIAEDTQLIVGHICMQWLSSRKPSGLSRMN